jgi:putative ABC transport system permease protein
MMTNWMQIWWRNLRRFKLYALINIAGLSFGVCAVVAIFLYVTDELSYDDFNLQSDLIFRVNSITRFADNENYYSTTSAALGDVAKTDIKDIEQVVRLFERQASVQLVGPKTEGKKFREEHFFFVDPSVFGVFTFHFLKGSPKNALKDPNGLVINRATAVKYFGTVDAAMGRDILFEGHRMLTVAGIIENYPRQSHLSIELLAHFDHFYNEESSETQQVLRTDWLYNPVSTYVLLKPTASTERVEAALNELKNQHADERAVKGVSYVLQPLCDIHLYSSFTFAEESASIKYVYILASIGVLILFIGCINFVNLSNVHSLKRAKEIGVRKVMGAEKRGLILQFLSESSALVMMSFVLAFGTLGLTLPYINEVSGKHFSIADLFTLKLASGLLSLFIVTAFLAGTYPSFYATRFSPSVILKGMQEYKHNEGFLLRKILVIFQFAVSVTLVVMGLVFYQQMAFIRDKPLGFQRNHLLTIPLFSETPNSILGGGVDAPLRTRMNTFESTLLQNSSIESVTVSSALPGTGAVSALVQTEKIKAEDNVFVSATAVDYDFLETYKMIVVAGRGFSASFGTDHLQSFVINEQAVKILGWEKPEQAIGQTIELMGKKGSVVGVVKDFHFQGLQQPLRPLILEVAAGKFTVFSIRLQADRSIAESIKLIKMQWDKIFPDRVFQYHFLDDRLEMNYGREQQMVAMMKYFAILAIFISTLGLFGLAAYINHMRSKEVCIRKVLGANSKQVFFLLSKEFLQMVITAFLIAVPIAYILASQWLNSFAFKITVGPLPFVVGCMIILGTVLVAISYEIINSINLNPAEKLRNE